MSNAVCIDGTNDCAPNERRDAGHRTQSIDMRYADTLQDSFIFINLTDKHIILFQQLLLFISGKCSQAGKRI